MRSKVGIKYVWEQKYRRVSIRRLTTGPQNSSKVNAMAVRTGHTVSASAALCPMLGRSPALAMSQPWPAKLTVCARDVYFGSHEISMISLTHPDGLQEDFMPSLSTSRPAEYIAHRLSSLQLFTYFFFLSFYTSRFLADDDDCSFRRNFTYHFRLFKVMKTFRNGTRIRWIVWNGKFGFAKFESLSRVTTGDLHISVVQTERFTQCFRPVAFSIKRLLCVGWWGTRT